MSSPKHPGRLHDPVWQAFEQDPAHGKPASPLQLERRVRGLREMRLGLFVEHQDQSAEMDARRLAILSQ